MDVGEQGMVVRVVSSHWLRERKKRPGVEYFHVDNVGRLQGADADEPVRSHTAASA